MNVCVVPVLVSFHSSRGRPLVWVETIGQHVLLQTGEDPSVGHRVKTSVCRRGGSTKDLLLSELLNPQEPGSCHS